MPVGSSARIIADRSRARGRSRRAAAVRRRAGSAGDRSRSPRPTATSASSARSRRSSAAMPAYTSGSSTFSSALVRESRLNSGTRSRSAGCGSPPAGRSSSLPTSDAIERVGPGVGRSRQPRMFISVDLPEPDGPMIATNSPRSMSSETPGSACTSTSQTRRPRPEWRYSWSGPASHPPQKSGRLPTPRRTRGVGCGGLPHGATPAIDDLLVAGRGERCRPTTSRGVPRVSPVEPTTRSIGDQLAVAQHPDASPPPPALRDAPLAVSLRRVRRPAENGAPAPGHREGVAAAPSHENAHVRGHAGQQLEVGILDADDDVVGDDVLHGDRRLAQLRHIAVERLAG